MFYQINGMYVLKRLLILCLCLSMQSCSRYFLQPTEMHIDSPANYGIAYEDIYFGQETGPRLHGWWFFAENTEVAKATILYLHGNAQNISSHTGAVYWLTQYGYDVFVFDYRGYGWSSGEAELSGAIDDIETARNYVSARASQRPLFIIGHSLGASMGIYSMASQSEGVNGMIWVAPFSEYPLIAREMLSRHWLTWPAQWLASWLVTKQYDPIEVVNQLSQQQLFLYSKQDEVVADDHVIRLHQRVPHSSFLVRIPGGHNSLFSSQQARDVIRQQLDQWLAVEDESGFR